LTQPGNRGSWAAAAERLDSFATGERPVALAGVAEEILSVARLLAGQPRLRRALTDPARTGADRADLLGQLLDGKVSEDTAGLMRLLVDGRWSSGAELLGATERLGVEALLATADSAGDLSDVEDELFRFGQIVNGDHQLAAALGNSTAPPAQRRQLLGMLLEGKANPTTLRLAEVALHGFGGRTFAHSVARLVELAAERRDRQIAYVTAASPLTDEQERRLGAALAQRYGRQIDLKVTVSPDVLGGLSVRVGHDLYDGTVLRRLNQARAALAGPA
jgi:F-type H+-transporting ATPase subunit delta